MTVAVFDTLKFATALRDRTSMPSEQAEGLVAAINEAFQDTVVARHDLDAVEKRLDANINGLRHDLEAVEARLKARIDALRHDLEAADARVEAKIDALRHDLETTDARLEAKIDVLRHDLEAVEARLDIKIEALRVDVSGQIAAAKADILRRMFGAIGFQSLVILGAVVLLARAV